MATSNQFVSSLKQKDKECVWHPFTQMKTAMAPIPIKTAKGLYLFDEDGNKYLDAISSWWVNLHGHTHPYIVKKIKQQLKRLEHVIFAGFTHAPAVELAVKLLEIIPGNMSKVFYSDNGSTAVEIALKMALQFWHNQNIDKQIIVCFKNSYHGDTFGAMSAAGRNEFNKPFWKHLFNVITIDPPMPNKEMVSVEQLNVILNKNNVACFIFEPLILGSGGMLIYSALGLNLLIKCCQDHSVLTISDEVMTGFGRTGPLFACEYLTEKPDLMCLSKGLTGGFLPLGVTACTERIYSAFLSNELSQAFLHGHSYTANPISCSSALASLDLLTVKSCALKRHMIHASHLNFCEKWRSDPKLQRCESLGTILVIEYKTSLTSYFQPISHKLYQFFLNKGILIRPLGNVLYLMPPYCITAEELDFIYDQIILTFGDNIL